ncbi:MAG: hypothetical protein Q9220_001004 [cf. Caloplaca sp. 1 TL-2023]
MLAIVLSSLFSIHVSAQTIQASTSEPPGGPQFNLKFTTAAGMSTHMYNMDPLTDRSTILKPTLEGNILHTTPSNVNSLSASDIAYISCDASAYGDGNIDAAGTFRLAAGKSPSIVSVVLYSLNATRCSFSPNNYGDVTIFSMKDSNTASDLLGILQSNTSIDGNATIGALDDGSNSSGGILGKSPTTAVAMIILYSITGLITALFLIIIVVGAIRAHRHPERYGPRNVVGRPRQSRAKGIARAMLETIPIVKFGDHDDPKTVNAPAQERDVEMEPRGPTAPDAPTQGPSQTSPAEITDIRETAVAGHGTTSREQAADSPSHPRAESDPIANADNGLACSVCTDDFSKGQDVRVLPCNHKFHPECIDPWLLNVSGTCPLCRVDLRPTASKGNEENGEGVDPPPRRHSEALTSFAASMDQQQSRRSSRAHPLHYLHHYLNRGRMEEATPQERLEALRRLRLVNHSDVNAAAPEDPAEASATAERNPPNGRNRLSSRFTRVFGGERSRPVSGVPSTNSPAPTAVPETRSNGLEPIVSNDGNGNGTTAPGEARS